MLKKMLLLTLTILIALSCTSVTLPGKWKLVYFGESKNCDSLPVIKDNHGIEKGAYYEFKENEKFYYHSPTSDTYDEGKWKLKKNTLTLYYNRNISAHLSAHFYGFTVKNTTNSYEIKELTSNKLILPYESGNQYFYCYKRIDE